MAHTDVNMAARPATTLAALIPSEFSTASFMLAQTVLRSITAKD